MIKKIVLTFLLCFFIVTVRSVALGSINYDEKTVAMMIAAFGTQAGMESYYTQQTDKILEHYQAAGVASAGIFASKFLDRKALTSLGGWSSSTENYYYKRIFHMVSRKIIPKMWDCAGIMLRNPGTAVYWGSYLLKTCDEVKSLCHQFESIVTNGRLSFRDIAFLEINENIKNIFLLSELGGVDWQATFDNLGTGLSMSFDELKSDVSTLYNLGVGLATSGWHGVAEGTYKKSSFHKSFTQKVDSISSITTRYQTLFDQSEGDIGGMVVRMVGRNLDSLFVRRSYDAGTWQGDYANINDKRYYKQRWYIYSVEEGSTILCDYHPDESNEHVFNGSDWYRIKSTDNNFSPDWEQSEAILQNSENYCGWSRAWVQNANAQNDGFTYYISYWMLTYYIYKGKDLYYCYAYNITVSKSWYNKQVAYEEEFDSYDMDMTAFRKLLQVRLDELNRNEDGVKYYIGYDSPRYYMMSDAGKLKGAETATISISCHGGANMGEGSTQYKCNGCGSNVNGHTKECVMSTSLTETGLDTREVDAKIAEVNDRISVINSQLSGLENDRKELLDKMRLSTGEEYIQLRQQYNAIGQDIDNLKAEKKQKEEELDEYQKARQEIIQSENVQTDDWYRIPAIMNDIGNAYKLQWQKDGRWEGNTYVRTAKMTGIKGLVSFRADVSIARKPKYFLGIKIHRAIVRIAWKLTTEYGDTEVVDVVNLDPSKSDEQKAADVNARIRAVQDDYPDCDVSVDYNKAEGGETDDTEDVYHLLWSSDRLAIARDIDTRLNKIYASLVCYEKMMYYKYNYIDYMRAFLPSLRDDQGRRYSLVQRCKRRWLKTAATHGGQEYDGRYDDD